MPQTPDNTLGTSSCRLTQPGQCPGTTATWLDGRTPALHHAILALWLFIIVSLALHHEMWRDEVRALAMALEPDNFLDIFQTLRNEGHPVLWYALLRAAHALWPTPVMLQMVSLLVALAAMAVWLYKAPFPLLMRLLFPFGMLPLVEYSVTARNYGISMLLLFLFALNHGRPQRNPWLAALLLALLANTNYVAILCSGILGLVWAWDEYSTAKALRPFIRRMTAPALLALAGMALATWTIVMDSNSTQAPPELVLSRNYLQSVLDSLLHPGRYFSHLMAAGPQLRDIVLWSLLAGLLGRPLYAGLLYGGLVLFNLFSANILFPQGRHQGVMYLLIITIYWLAAADSGQDRRRIPLLAGLWLVLTPLFLHHIALAEKKITEEVTREISASAALGSYINTNFQLRDAVILGDPDYLLGALRYYVKNPIYYVREKRYGAYERYVKVPQQHVTLGELLAAAEDIRADKGVPVLILLQHRDIPLMEQYTSFPVSGRWLVTNREEALHFAGATIKLGEFNNALSDENYEMFLLPLSRADYLRRHGDYSQRMEPPSGDGFPGSPAGEALQPATGVH